jgi:hypothetical protein
MAESHIVFNDQLELYGQRFITKTAEIPPGEILDVEFQRKKILALLFEQFLLFDKIAVKIDFQNLPLFFLIKTLGIDKLQELIERNIVIPVLWTPGIYMVTGTQRDDGTVDQSTIMGRPPFVSGWLHNGDPAESIDTLLKYFVVSSQRKKAFKRAVVDKYVLPNNDLARQSVDIVIDAYKKNRLAGLSLPALKEPEDLNLEERSILYSLGHQVLETSVLAEKMYKSYDKYENLHLAEEAIKNIESAYHVSENTSTILTVEKIADIKQMILEGTIPFNRVFDMRYKPVIKEYRKWINTVSVYTDAEYITKQYFDEVTGVNRFIESKQGKFLRTVGMLGIGSGIGAALTGSGGILEGAAVAKAADFGLSLLDTYVLDGILKGWNPRMFVDKMKIEAAKKKD